MMTAARIPHPPKTNYDALQQLGRLLPPGVLGEEAVESLQGIVVLWGE